MPMDNSLNMDKNRAKRLVSLKFKNNYRAVIHMHSNTVVENDELPVKRRRTLHMIVA